MRQKRIKEYIWKSLAAVAMLLCLLMLWATYSTLTTQGLLPLMHELSPYFRL